MTDALDLIEDQKYDDAIEVLASENATHVKKTDYKIARLYFSALSHRTGKYMKQSTTLLKEICEYDGWESDCARRLANNYGHYFNVDNEPHRRAKFIINLSIQQNAGETE